VEEKNTSKNEAFRLKDHAERQRIMTMGTCIRDQIERAQENKKMDKILEDHKHCHDCYCVHKDDDIGPWDCPCAHRGVL
jgi:methyl coenzyme M reductase beta subunit